MRAGEDTKEVMTPLHSPPKNNPVEREGVCDRFPEDRRTPNLPSTTDPRRGTAEQEHAGVRYR